MERLVLRSVRQLPCMCVSVVLAAVSVCGTSTTVGSFLTWLRVPAEGSLLDAVVSCNALDSDGPALHCSGSQVSLSIAQLPSIT